MASTRKGGSDSSGKDKKPSKSFSRSNTAPTSSPLTTRTPKKPTTTNPKPQSPDKNAPNYLKPTLSSQSENSTSTSTSTPTSTSISRFLKKQAPDDGSPKTSTRRRSFERPPSVQQSGVTSSPKGRISQPVSVRTTSFYPSISTKAGSQSARAVSRDKPSQAPLKSSGSVPSSKPAKTSRRSLTLSAPSNKAMHHGKAPASKKAAPAPSVTAGYDDNEPLNLGDDIEEIASIGSNADLVPFDQIELSTSGDVNDCLSKKTTPREDDEHVPSPVAVQKEEEDIVNKQGEGEDMNNKSESGSDRKEQSLLADPTDSITPKREDRHNDKEGKMLAEKEEEEVKLALVEAPVPEEGKLGVQEKGKKQSPVYNDVIKEAASKLLEKRKNKVSALVGAFETVISLQDTDS